MNNLFEMTNVSINNIFQQIIQDNWIAAKISIYDLPLVIPKFPFSTKPLKYLKAINLITEPPI